MSPDRDHILEQALKHELRAADIPATDACLDAETLGAWADDGLDAAAMVAAEAHVSACARCQAMVAAFARGTGLGIQAPSAPLAPSPRAPGTLAWWKFLVPIAAGVTAVTLWMVVPEQQKVAIAPAQPAAPAQAPAAAESVAPAPAPPAAIDQTAERKDKPVVDTRDLRRRSIDDNARKELEAKQEKAAAPAREQAAADAVPAAPPPAAAARSGAPIAELQKSNRLAFAPLEIVSPDPARRWRVAGGAIERSEDAGASWTPIRAGSGETITAGSAPSGSICWLVGTNGLVLITVDGVTFARVPLTQSVDLTSITAADALGATVTAADGRRFRTDDSGRTWRPF